MEDFLHNDDFESYLQKKAGQFRMYPNDKVWRNIRKNMHGETQWPGLSAISFIVVAVLIIGTLIIKPRPDILNSNYHFTLQSPGLSSNPEIEKISLNSKNIVSVDEHFSIERITRNTISAVSEKLNQGRENNIEIISETSFANQTNNDLVLENIPLQSKELIASNTNTKITLSSNSFKQGIGFDELKFQSRNLFDKMPKNKRLNFLTSFPEYLTKRNIDKTIQFPVAEVNKDLNHKNTFEKLKNKSSKFEFRFYITPSVSYRIQNHTNDIAKIDSITTITPVESNFNIDPDNAINQRPAIGYETGFGLGYRLSKKISITGGLQFNISQYNVDASLYKNEEVTDVTLENNGITSTYTSYSNVRSTTDNNAVTFKTRYYQASIPIGIDFKAINLGNFTLGIAGSIQPTYTFDKLPLIISSNYKNYADGSRFIRNWNFNTAFETYLSYTSGSYRWQVGPQFRYQWLPSLQNQYPTKENLFNAGLKLGVIKYLRQ